MKRFFFLILLFLLAVFTPAAFGEGDVVTIWVYVNESGFYPEARHETESYPGRHLYALGKLREKYPGIEIAFKRWDPNTPKGPFITALMAGTPGYDCLLVPLLDEAGLFAADLIVDLAQYPPLMEVLSTWPDLLGLMGDGTHLYSVPEELAVQMVQVNDEALYNTLGFQIDSGGWTMETLFRMGDALYEYNQANAAGKYLLTTYNIPTRPFFWIHQWIANACQGKTAEEMDMDAFRFLAQGWKTLLDRNLIPETSYLRQEGASQVLFVFGTREFPLTIMRSLLPQPVYRLDIQRQSGIRTRGYLVNAASPYKAQLLDYLTYYCSTPGLESSLRCFHNGLIASDFTRDQFIYYDRDLEIILTPTNEQIAQWNEAIETGYRVEESEILWTVVDLLEAYFYDQLTLDECAQQTYARVKMLMEE